ncbi:hypothetical protein [Peribacillus sp. TH16]|uniref:hypothetical protein n=1 Tax=Peribacillus sp. TH16 TaxID=2798482 RepID=UPI001A931020|nr:hypothetical protein [Peribacillus sp. TH16]
MNKVNEIYGLSMKSINPFKELVDDENSKFEIPLEAMPLLGILLLSVDANPFFRINADVKKIDAEKIISFNKA